MSPLGIIGGLGPESTAVYVRVAHEVVRERVGKPHTARLIVDSLDFADLAAAQAGEAWSDVSDMLVASARRLAGAGAVQLVIACNTVHRVADHVQAAISCPLLHVADAAGAALQNDGRSRVGLLGTRHTMEGGFLEPRLARFGVSTVLPAFGDQQRLHDIIMTELLHGVTHPTSRAWIDEVIRRLATQGADAVLLACTELSLLFPTPSTAPLPTYDTSRMHVRAALATLLDG